MLFIAAKGLYPLNLDDALTPSGMTKNIRIKIRHYLIALEFCMHLRYCSFSSYTF